MKFLYLLVDFFTVIIPVIFSFHPKLNFYKKWKSFFIGNLLVAVVFICWDVIFTAAGVWGFNPDYVLGFSIFNLPVEEILFFICIPFACVFTYHCASLFYHRQWKPTMESFLVLFFSIALLAGGFYFIDKLYTSSTFLSLSILLIVLKYIAKINWLARLIIVYPILLIPFFIVNGILTGRGLQHPVVWYNNAENLGIRLFTIPLEDIFYGFELILLNVFLFEHFEKIKKPPVMVAQ